MWTTGFDKTLSRSRTSIELENTELRKKKKKEKREINLGEKREETRLRCKTLNRIVGWTVKIREWEGCIVIGGDRERKSHSVSILGEYTILMPLREHLQTPIYHVGSRNEGDLCAEISDRELRERNNFSELLPRVCGCLSMNESHFGLDRDSFPCERSFVPLPQPTLYSATHTNVQ